TAGRPRCDHRSGPGGGRGRPGDPHRGRAAAALPRPPRARPGQAADRAARRKHRQGVARGPLHHRGSRSDGCGRRTAGHGDDVVRRRRRHRRRPQHRAPHPGGRLPRTDRQGAAMTRPQATALDLTPAPGAAPMPRMALAQAGAAVGAMLGNGQQLLLTMIIPVLLLVAFAALPLVDMGTRSRTDCIRPRVVALAMMAAAFTGQALSTGFERRNDVLTQLGATPLPRRALLLAKTVAVLAGQRVETVVIVT